MKLISICHYHLSGITKFRSNLLNSTVFLSFLLFLFININLTNVAAQENNKVPRILLIGVDAIPYSIIRNLTDAKSKYHLFDGFKGPTAVINSFPSNSHVAWSGLLELFNVAKPPGYEGRYFDLDTQKLIGGISLFDEPTDWQKYFKWRIDGIVSTAFAYGWPEHYSQTEIDDGLEAFYLSDQQYFSMYIVSTDGIGHTKGPDVLVNFLIALDQKLKKFKQRHPDMPFNTVLVSDHGMAGGIPLVNIITSLTKTLENAGYSLTDELENERQVALISFGLLTSFVAYTQDKNKQKIAQLASGVTGVALCATQDKTGWRVINSAGTALIHHKTIKGKSFWRYEIQSADPLDYKNLLQKLESVKGTNPGTHQVWFSDQQWFDVSKNHRYPDALFRIANGFNLVTNPASIACSVSPGYMFGSLLTEYIAIPTVGPLKWTHGALHRDASLGFLMSDIPDWQAPDMIRYNKALEFLYNKIHHDLKYVIKK